MKLMKEKYWQFRILDEMDEKKQQRTYLTTTPQGDKAEEDGKRKNAVGK